MRVDRTEVAQGARNRLAGADYADAFRVAADGPHPAEQWARRALEGGPSGVRRRLFRQVLFRGVLGLRLGPLDSPDHVAGWAIVENEPGRLVLHADSWLIVARLVIDASDSHTTLTTLVRYERRAARSVWAVVGSGHRRLAPKMLGRAGLSLARPA